MKLKITFIILLLSFLFINCNETAINIERQYVITWYADENQNDPNWFKVIDIHTNTYQTVPAVMELEGTYYLPIMSRMPSFDNKVVTGEFFMDQPHGSQKPDTVFKVTKHLRDTVVVGWGS